MYVTIQALIHFSLVSFMWCKILKEALKEKIEKRCFRKGLRYKRNIQNPTVKIGVMLPDDEQEKVERSIKKG